MTDPYQTLGVAKDATPDQIRGAYRKLAKQYHPDLNPGNKKAEERFKEVAAANDLLSDTEKRAAFDRGEVNAAGDPRPDRAYYRSHAEQGSSRYGNTEDMGDIFADLFAQSRTARPARGRDIAYSLAISFADAISGAQQRLTLPDGKGLDVRIPPGMEDGQSLRLRGQGGEGQLGAPAGDALITVHVKPHPHFRREGADVLLDLPVTLKEAVLGGRVTIPTVTGQVTMTIPARSDTGAVLRLRGRGVAARAGQPAGDQLVTLRVTVADADDALAEFLRGWTPAKESNPRKDMP